MLKEWISPSVSSYAAKTLKEPTVLHGNMEIFLKNIHWESLNTDYVNSLCVRGKILKAKKYLCL